VTPFSRIFSICLSDFRYQFGPLFCTPPKTGLLFDYKNLAKKKQRTNAINEHLPQILAGFGKN